MKRVDLTPEQAAEAFKQYGSRRAAAQALDVPRTTFKRRLRESGFQTEKIEETEEHKLELHRLQERNRDLLRELKTARTERLTDQEVRREIFELRDTPPQLPDWLIAPPKASHGTIGVPTLNLSDSHWGEEVKPEQVFYLNKYNQRIAGERLHRVTERTVDLLLHHMVNPSYPGIVCSLSGDMLSGDIHDELAQTNEKPLMAAFTDIQDHLTWTLSTLADHFGRVFVPCVTGNHGRNTRKPRFKDRNLTNFDWLLYTQLERWFRDDPRIQFRIATGMDLHYRIYNHRYRLTHGDAFRGGEGFVGMHAPVIRGEIKKRKAAASYNKSYDTLSMGHFHQCTTLKSLIVNGSLKGYDEYAIGKDLDYEPPKQALWMTHPQRGITVTMPVQADKDMMQVSDDNSAWVSWEAEMEAAHE